MRSTQLTAFVASAGAVDYAISVEGKSFPPPSYQWQMLVNVTVNRTSNPVNLTTRGFHDSMLRVMWSSESPSLCWLGSSRRCGQADPLSIVFSTMMARGPIEAREEVQVEVPIQVMGTFCIVIVTDAPYQDFVPIPGATFSTLLVNGTDEWDGATVRCLLYTTGGTTATNNFTVMIGAALPTTYRITTTFALLHSLS